MKRLIAGLIGFGLPALAAILVAVAPLNSLSLQLAAIFGGSSAVVVLLILAVVLGIGAYFLFKPKPDASDISDVDADRIAAWTPDPLPHDSMPELDLAPHILSDPAADARLETLRRRTFPEDYANDEASDEIASSPAVTSPTQNFDQTTPAPIFTPEPDFAPELVAETTAMVPVAAPTAPTPPVILVRKVRERDRDWFADTSWFGALPKLGDAAWPRDTRNTPLPFVAQIDLASLVLPEDANPLPRTGSLAFFLGSGAVIAVPYGADDFTDPPHDLPPAYDEGGLPFPETTGRLSRYFFPFWPIEAITLNLPETLLNHRNARQEVVIQSAMATQLSRHATLRDHPFYAAGVGAPVENLWWHSVIHLTDHLHEAMAHAEEPIFAQQRALKDQLAKLDLLRANPQADPEAIEEAEETSRAVAADIETMLHQRAELPMMIEALDQFVDERDPWAPLTPEELEVVADLLSEVHERFGELVRTHVPGTLTQLATVSLRTIVTGPAEILATMPDAMLERINSGYRLPPVDPHQMFGLPAGHAARHEHADDILLLQLGYDDMMEWCWAESGLYQFWISPKDAAAGNWGAVRLTFESD